MDRTTTAEGHQAFWIIGRSVVLDRSGREILWPALPIGQSLGRTVVLTGANRQTVLGCARRRHRTEIDYAIRIPVPALVACGEADEHVTTFVNKLVNFKRLLIINSKIPDAAPR